MLANAKAFLTHQDHWLERASELSGDDDRHYRHCLPPSELVIIARAAIDDKTRHRKSHKHIHECSLERKDFRVREWFFLEKNKILLFFCVDLI